MDGNGGYLYIISNDAWPGWYKVGTTENLTKRLHTYQTSSPFRDYNLLYSLHHPKYKEAEILIKETMKHFAIEIRNEWYKCDFSIVKSRLEEQLDDLNNGEFRFIKNV